MSVEVSGDLASNSTEVLSEWALAGMGLAMKSTWDIEEELRDGRLVTLLDDHVTQAHALYVLYQDRRYLPARIRTFVDFMAARFETSNS